MLHWEILSEWLWCLQAENVSELYQHAQKYNSQLQEYNGKLQNDLQGSADQVRQLTVCFPFPHHILCSLLQLEEHLNCCLCCAMYFEH